MDYFFNPIIAGGGSIMVAIFFCSFLMWWLLMDSVQKVYAEKKALKFLQSNDWNRSFDLKKSLFYPFIKEFSERKKAGHKNDQILPALSKGLDLILPQLERRLSFAGTIVQIAPLLGLLGTVSGMIMTFEGLRTQEVSSHVFSEGISKALYTTEFGLLVAIPGVYLGFLMNRRVSKLNTEFRVWLFNYHQQKEMQ